MNQQTPIVSVTMPVYNAARYIRETIESLLAQTFTSFEIVIVNDASQDESESIIHSFQDPRIRYFTNEVNSGIVATRNRCVQEARGKYIAILDNDDIALPDRLEKQVQFLEQHPDFGVCGSFWEIIDGAGHKLARVESPIQAGPLKTFLLFNNCYCAATVMFRASLLKKHQYEKGSDMIEDFNLYQRVYPETQFGMLPLVLAQYRAHGNNESIRKLDGLRALRHAIDRQILQRTGIPFTAEEAAVHSDFLTGNFQSFRNPERIRSLEQWLMKWISFLEQKPELDSNTALTLFIRRWITLFYNNRQLSARFITSPLIQRNKKIFLRCLADFFRERTAKKIQLC